MKISFLLFSSFIVVLTVSGQSMYTTYSGLVVPALGVLPPSEIHPSLYFAAGDTQAVRQRQSINSKYAGLWKSIQSNITSFKSKTASGQDESDRPRMAKYCAFGWIINKDPTAKSKAIEALMIAYDNVPRTNASTSFDKPYDEIYRATWLQNYCEAYDWVQDQLTLVQDSTIRAKIAQEVLLLVNNMVVGARYAPRPHNHRSKPAYAIGTAALTLSSDPRAKAWLDSALFEQNTVTHYQYSADGIYREGNHYNIYAMVNGLPFLWHYKNVSGVDLFPYYASVFENPVQVRFSSGMLHTFEDSYLKPFMTHMAAAAYTTTTTSLSSVSKLSEVLQWNFSHTKLYTPNYTGASNDVTWDIDEYLLYDSSIGEAAPDRYPSINLQYGQTVLRKNWNDNDPKNRVLLFHGVAEADNHNHPDQLAIMFEAENAIMATAPGYGPDGSSDAKRTTWYLQPYANNIVTVDAVAPTDPVANQTPATPHFLTGSDEEYVEKNVSYSNDASWTRGISFPHKNYYVVRDLVQSSASRTHRWFMHARGTLSINGINARWTLPSDSYGSAAIFDLFAVSTNNAVMSSNGGYVSFANGHEESAPYVSLQNTGMQTQFFSILYPRSMSSPPPVVANIGSGNVCGLTVTYSDTMDIHISQNGSSTVTAGSVSTDAKYTTISQKSQSVNSFSIIDGTSLQYGGTLLLSTSDRVSLSCRFLESSKVAVDAESLSTETTVTVGLPFPSSLVTDVSVNNVANGFSIAGDSSISIVKGTPAAVVSFKNLPLPTTIELRDNYPNPFNPVTSVEFSVAAEGKTTLTVYTLSGRKVAELFNRRAEPGILYTIAFDGTDLASGIYLYQLEFGSSRIVKKMVLLK